MNRTVNRCILIPLALLYIPKHPRVVGEAGEKTISDHFITLKKCKKQTRTYERVRLLAIAHKSDTSKYAWVEEV